MNLQLSDEKSVLKRHVENILKDVTPDTVNISASDELPLNYTVNCFFHFEDLTKIEDLIQKLKLVDPNQLFYTTEQLHLTILGEIAITTDPGDIISVVQAFLKRNTLSFHLLGIGSSRSVSSVSAYPISFSLSEIRRNLRDLGSGSVFDGPYEELGWINFMRFRETPSSTLLSALQQEINTDFGIIKPKSIRLLRNASRMLHGAEIVHTFAL